MFKIKNHILRSSSDIDALKTLLKAERQATQQASNPRGITPLEYRTNLSRLINDSPERIMKVFNDLRGDNSEDWLLKLQNFQPLKLVEIAPHHKNS